MNCTTLKVGDYVWTGEHRRERIEQVSKITSTLIVLGKGGEFNRYHKASGRQTANLMWRRYIEALATNQEVSEWQREQVAKKKQQDNAAMEAQADAEMKVCLERLFNGLGVHACVSSEGFGSKEERDGKYTLSLHGLTEDDIRLLARQIRIQK